MPDPRGNPLSTTCFVDANHAGCCLTRRSQTGIIFFCNCAPIIWVSKRQTTVESITFGSKSIAMKSATLQYKLRMSVIPVEEATQVLCNNQAMVRNTTMPESTLKIKHNSIAYHCNWKCIALGMAIVGKVNTDNNVTDLGTKVLPLPKRKRLLEMVTW